LRDGITLEDVNDLQRRGVNLARLAAGLSAFVAGQDVNVAADAGINAAQNNALDTIWDALSILYDSGKIGYGLYKGDDGLVREGFVDLTADSAALLVPMVPAGLTKLKRATAAVNNTVDAARAGDKVVDGVDATQISVNDKGN
jgi:hypothetical protein